MLPYTPNAGEMSFIFTDCAENMQSLSADALSSDALNLFVKSEPLSPGGGLQLALPSLGYGFGHGMFNDLSMLRPTPVDAAAVQQFLQTTSELQYR